MQFNGGRIQDELYCINLRFRKHHFFVADIKIMYRVVLIQPSERDLLKILFKNNENKSVKVFKICTVLTAQLVLLFKLQYH